MNRSWASKLQQQQQQRNLKTNSRHFELSPGNDEIGFRKKGVRDPLSHRIIEKRRRDRMNSCLLELSRLIPTSCLKKARGRIEKTEIIEMAIRHLKILQAHTYQQKGKCDLAVKLDLDSSSLHHFRFGYQECTSEVMQFLIEMEGYCSGDTLYVRLLNHLQEHYDKLARGYDYNINILKDPNFPNTNEEVEMTPDNSSFTQSTNSLSSWAVDSKDSVMIPKPEFESTCTVANNIDSKQIDSEESIATATKTEYPLPKADDEFYVYTAQNNSILQSALDKRCHENGNSEQAEYEESHPYLLLPEDDGRYSLSAELSKTRPVSVNSSRSSSRSDEVYKFKTNIKERFHAELQHHQLVLPELQVCCDLEMDTNDECSLKPIQKDTKCKIASDPIQCYINLPSLIDIQVMKNMQNNGCAEKNQHNRNYLPDSEVTSTSPLLGTISDRVPMFVLHPKRNFYVPMTIDTNTIESLLNKFCDTEPVLHPVSITVYFGNPLNVPNSPIKPVISLSHMPGTLLT